MFLVGTNLMNLDKYNLVGVFYPYDRVVLYVTDNKNLTRLDFQDNETLNLDTNFFQNDLFYR